MNEHMVLRPLVLLRIILITLLVSSSVVTQMTQAQAVGISCMPAGSGIVNDPWLITNSADLTCFEVGTLSSTSPDNVAYVSLTADVVKTNNTKLFSNSQSLINFEGNNHKIWIKNVSDFKGLFRDSRSSSFRNFTIQADNSKLQTDGSDSIAYGWVISQDYEGSYSNIDVFAPIDSQNFYGNGGLIGVAEGSYVVDSSSEGVIGAGAGGIIARTNYFSVAGMNLSPSSIPTRVVNTYSTGTIGAGAGGIVGIAFTKLEISKSFSTGLIDNGGGGGIVGQSQVQPTDVITVEESYSRGQIGNNSGGILGQYSSNFVIRNVYSEGDIHNNGGGIVGAFASDGVVENSYTLGTLYTNSGGIFGELDYRSHTPTASLLATNVYVVGDFAPSVTDAGGVAPPGPNAATSGTITVSSLEVQYLHIYSPENGSSSGWSDTNAALVLTGWANSTKWIHCNVNTPALIAALSPSNPCSPPLVCNLNGNGLAATPWLVQSSDDLQCLETGIWLPLQGAVAYVSLQADVVKRTNTKLFGGTPGISIHFSGHSHSITVDGVQGFEGLFRDFSDSIFEDFSVVSIRGASLLPRPNSWSPNVGWVVAQDVESTFDNVHIHASVSEGNGGIVGTSYGSYVLNSSSSREIGNYAGGLIQATLIDVNATPSTRQARIENSYSEGSIGVGSGGLLGFAIADTFITKSYSIGPIDNGGSGGLVGQSQVQHPDLLVVEASYSTGRIGNSSGGILGAYSSNFVIRNVFTEGDIYNSAGGIVGANASDGVVENSYSLGTLFTDAGGVFGQLITDYDQSINQYNQYQPLLVSHVYVAGFMDSSSNNPGGIAPPGPNSLIPFTISTPSVEVNYANVYIPENRGPLGMTQSVGWSDTNAALVLSGWADSTKWTHCSQNMPALIAAFFSSDPCAPASSPTPTPSSSPTSSSSPSISPSAAPVSLGQDQLAKTGMWLQLPLLIFVVGIVSVTGIQMIKRSRPHLPRD